MTTPGGQVLASECVRWVALTVRPSPDVPHCPFFGIYAGHYYSNPTNWMWRILKETGIAPPQIRWVEVDKEAWPVRTFLQEKCLRLS